MYNHAFQEKVYFSVISPRSQTGQKVISLLYHVANSQSQPNLDRLERFYKKVYERYSNLTSFSKFLEILGQARTNTKFKSLYEGLNKQDGWGPKTAALFTKIIYHLHSGFYPEQLKIWADVPPTIENDDKLCLPVDTVITEIFRKLDPSKKWDFKEVNNELESAGYKGTDIEIWDDLWFWGFITQKVENSTRKFEWNEAKYWSKMETDKHRILEIKEKAEQFLTII